MATDTKIGVYKTELTQMEPNPNPTLTDGWMDTSIQMDVAHPLRA